MSAKSLPIKMDILARLHCATGHLQAVTNMVEAEEPYEEILHQLHAIQASISKVSQLLIQHEANQCLSMFQEQPNVAALTKIRQLIENSNQLH